MKKLPRILTVFFLACFILQMICLFFLMNLQKANATAEPSQFTPQVAIDGSQFQKGVATAPSIAKYIQAVYNYAIGVVGILAAIILMYAGVRWLTAGGSPEAVNDAKAWISASLTGLVLALCSYAILKTVNPDLVNLEDVTPAGISTINQQINTTCCAWDLYESSSESNKIYKDCQINVSNETCQEQNRVFGGSSWAPSGGSCKEVADTPPGGGTASTIRGWQCVQLTAAQIEANSNQPTAELPDNRNGADRLAGQTCGNEGGTCKKDCSGNFEWDQWGGPSCVDGVRCCAPKANEGEACGNNGGSTCKRGSCDLFEGDWNGRSCVDGTYCCEP